jgi:flavin-dependent dehydrogenase
MVKTLGPINNDSVIVIIGGGPGGTSCAVKLKKLALQKGLNPRIILYEGKIFEKRSYYNQCLGVLSPPIEDLLDKELDIPFPSHIVQRKIEGYCIHSDKNEIKLSGEHEPSFACRRVEFDNYLFQKAREVGTETYLTRVIDLDFDQDGVMVFSESNNIKADVVVGAFGMDDGMAKVFERLTPYKQPKFLSSVVTKIHPGEAEMQRFGSYIHAFLPSSLPCVEFGAITPKGNHLSLNIAGKKVNAAVMDKFLELDSVRKELPANIDDIIPHLYYFKGKFPTLPSKEAYGDRYVMTGDAAGWNRPFKGKGINSAIITGIKAAEAMVYQGISKEAFQSYQKSCSELTCDIPYGKAIRSLSLKCKKFGFLDSICEAAKEEPALEKAFFNIVSGQETYKRTWKQTRSVGFVLRTTFKVLKNRIFKT